MYSAGNTIFMGGRRPQLGPQGREGGGGGCVWRPRGPSPQGTVLRQSCAYVQPSGMRFLGNLGPIAAPWLKTTAQQINSGCSLKKNIVLSKSKSHRPDPAPLSHNHRLTKMLSCTLNVVDKSGQEKGVACFEKATPAQDRGRGGVGELENPQGAWLTKRPAGWALRADRSGLGGTNWHPREKSVNPTLQAHVLGGGQSWLWPALADGPTEAHWKKSFAETN